VGGGGGGGGGGGSYEMGKEGAIRGRGGDPNKKKDQGSRVQILQGCRWGVSNKKGGVNYDRRLHPGKGYRSGEKKRIHRGVVCRDKAKSRQRFAAGKGQGVP